MSKKRAWKQLERIVALEDVSHVTVTRDKTYVYLRDCHVAYEGEPIEAIGKAYTDNIGAAVDRT